MEFALDGNVTMISDLVLSYHRNCHGIISFKANC